MAETPFRIAPRRAHAEPLAARVFGLRRALEHGLHVHQFRGLDAGIRADRLRAIAAILRTPAGLDAEQGAQLDFGGGVIGAVDAGGLEQQFGEREVEEGRDFIAGPVGAGVGHLRGISDITTLASGSSTSASFSC
jgi:hypothetical protein